MGSGATRAGWWEVRRVSVYVGYLNNGPRSLSAMVSSGYPVAPLTQTLSPSQASANPAISLAPFMASARPSFL